MVRLVTAPQALTVRKATLWHKCSAGVLAWEGVAAVTDVAKQRGYSSVRLPYITEITRGLPRLARVGVALGIGLACYDHFRDDGRRRWF